MSTPPPTSPHRSHPPLPPHPHSSNTTITIILTITILILFIIGFFAVYFCKCFIQRFCRSWRLRNSPSGTPVGPAGAAAQGLDPAIIKAFPSFMYSTVKEYRREKYGLECAICLCEFQDSDILRLLTSCCHVFHQDCIDLWLESHTSCPVCRRTLEAPEVYAPSPDVVSIRMQEEASSDHSVRITIEEDNERERNKGDSDIESSDRRNEVFSDALQEDAPAGTSGGGENDEEQEEEEIEVEKFSRSKTTGHSIVKKKEVEGNKYTLILPDHVRAKLLRGHNATRSETTFGEFKSKTTTGNGGFGEVSELSRGDDNNV